MPESLNETIGSALLNLFQWRRKLHQRMQDLAARIGSEIKSHRKRADYLESRIAKLEAHCGIVPPPQQNDSPGTGSTGPQA